MINWKKVACLLLASMLVSQSVVTDGGMQMVKAEEATATVKEENVLEIATVNDFKAFANKVNSGHDFEGETVRLVNDIIFDGVTINNFEPITGIFRGVFDGAGYSISGIIMTGEYGCLFKTLNGGVHDLSLDNCEFNTTYAATIAYYSGYSQIYNCNFNSCTIKGKTKAAGLIIEANDMRVYNCNLTNCIIKGGAASGVFLEATSSIIGNCINNSNIKGNSVATGFIGKAVNCCLENDINRGDITLEQSSSSEANNYYCAAGLVGAMCGTDISNCANEGDIKGQYSDVDAYYKYYYPDDFEKDKLWYEDLEDFKDMSLNQLRKTESDMQISKKILLNDSLDDSSNEDATQNTVTEKALLVNTGGLVGEIYVRGNNSENYIQNCYHTGKVSLEARKTENTGSKGEAKELIGVVGTITTNGQTVSKGEIVTNGRTTFVVLSNCYFPLVDGEETETGVYQGDCTNRNMIAKDVEEMKTVSFLNTLNHNRGINKDWTRWQMTDSYPAHVSTYPLTIKGSLLSTYEADTELTLTITPNEIDYEDDIYDVPTVDPSTGTSSAVVATPEPILGSVTINDGKVSLIDHGNYVYSFLMPNETANIVYTGKNIAVSAELPDIPDATEQPEATPTPTVEPSLTPAPTPLAPTTTVPAPTDGNQTTAEPTTPAISETNTPTANVAKEPVVDPVNKELVLYVGGNTQNTKSYKVKITNVTDYELSYESSKTSVATVSSNGKITAKKAGSAKIYVHVKDKTSGKTTSFVLANVTVKKAGLSFTKKVSTLKVGKKANFKVQKNGVKGTVKWTVSNKKLASVTSKGVLKGKKVGKVKVTATCGKKKVTANVTIKK